MPYFKKKIYSENNVTATFRRPIFNGVREFLLLIHPSIKSLNNQLRRQSWGERLRNLALISFGLLFWSGIFFIFYKVLLYFQGTELIGDILTKKLLSMVFLVFFSILIFSNIITALSTYFLSNDLNLIIGTPVELNSIYFSKFLETAVSSSWMVVLFGIPVFIAYGIVLNAPLVYYLGLAGIIVPFLIIPTAVGASISIILVNLFPARRTKDILFLLSILFVAGLYILIRLLKPEQFTDADAFNNVMEYFLALRMPDSSFSPHTWATEGLFAFLRPGPNTSGFALLLLWSTSLAFVVIGNWVFSGLYTRGWSKAQEGKRITITRAKSLNTLLNAFTSPFHPSFKAIVQKDIRIFFRDTTQWSQILLLSALVFVYLYNFSVMPFEQVIPMAGFFFKNLFSFLNMGLAGFVLSAIAVRFVFPSVSLEAKSYWLLKSSPITTKHFLWSKFWIGWIPLMILGEILIIVSNHLLHVTDFMMALSVCTIFFMTFGIASLGVGVGAMYPRFNVDNPSKIATGFGGIAYMILSMAYIGLNILLEAWPVYIIFTAPIKGFNITLAQWSIIALSFGTLLLLNFLVLIIPMRLGLRRLERLEI